MARGTRTFNRDSTQISCEPQAKNPPVKVQIHIISGKLRLPEISPEPAWAG